MNYFFWINDAVQQMLTSSGDPFLQAGQECFQVVAVLMIVFHGIRIMIPSGEPLNIAGLIRYLFLMVVCLTLLQFYNLPAPGFDNTLHGYITGTGAWLANQIDVSMTEKVTQRFNDVILGMEVPAWHDVFSAIGAYMHYYFCVAALTAMQSVMFCVVAFGWVACGVLVLFGPLFIPLMLVPYCEQWFWGWLSALVQYSFYPVVANAFVFVYGHAMMNFFDYFPPPYDSAKIASMALVTIGLAFSMVFGFFKISSFVSGMFQGRSGEHTLPGVGWWRG